MQSSNGQHISKSQIAEDIVSALADAHIEAEVVAVGPELTERGGNPATMFAGAIVRHAGQEYKIHVPEHYDAERYNRIGRQGAFVRDWHMLAAHVVGRLSR
jgi:hypothetical protein